MGALTVSNRILEKYFSFLKILDVKSKKRLILKLEESIKAESNTDILLNSYFGAWEDDKDTNTIISEIVNSRVDKSISESF